MRCEALDGDNAKEAVAQIQNAQGTLEKEALVVNSW